jgi:hypothetical protein
MHKLAAAGTGSISFDQELRPAGIGGRWHWKPKNMPGTFCTFVNLSAQTKKPAETGF